MAVYSNLSGSGALGLSPSVSQLRVDVVTFGNGTSIGSAAPADYFKLGALRLGNQGSYYPVRYIDGASIILDCPPGVTTLGYNLFTTTVVTVTEVFSAVANWEKQPWDRNPAPVAAQSYNAYPGGTPQTTTWSYTVPTGRLLYVAGLWAAITRNVAATTILTPLAEIFVENLAVVTVAMLSNTVGAETVSGSDSNGLIVPSGHTLISQVINNDTGGYILVASSMTGYLFDA